MNTSEFRNIMIDINEMETTKWNRKKSASMIDTEVISAIIQGAVYTSVILLIVFKMVFH